MGTGRATRERHRTWGESRAPIQTQAVGKAVRELVGLGDRLAGPVALVSGAYLHFLGFCNSGTAVREGGFQICHSSVQKSNDLR